MTKIDRIKIGDNIHDRTPHNALIDAHNRSARPTLTTPGDYGSGGVNQRPVSGGVVWLFKLTSTPTYPTLSDATFKASSSFIDTEPTPYATAKKLQCHQFNVLDVDDDTGDMLRSYNTTGAKTETIWFPTAYLGSYGEYSGLPVAWRSGDRVYAVFNDDSGRWEVIAPPSPFRDFELKATLLPGSHASAYILSGGAIQYDQTFTVYDIHGIYSGRRRDAFASPNDNGARGTAFYNPGYNGWTIAAMQGHATLVRGQAVEAFDGGDLNIELDKMTVLVMQPLGGLLITDPADNLTVSNVFGHSADLYGKVIAAYETSHNTWSIVQTECPA